MVPTIKYISDYKISGCDYSILYLHHIMWQFNWLASDQHVDFSASPIIEENKKI